MGYSDMGDLLPSLGIISDIESYWIPLALTCAPRCPWIILDPLASGIQWESIRGMQYNAKGN